MQIRQAYRYELKPNAAQRVLCAKHVGVARFAWNWGLAGRIARFETEEGGERFSDAMKDHKGWNVFKREHAAFAYEVSKCSAQEALRDLDRAFRNFTQARKNGHRVGFPRFKRKGVRDSCRFSTGAIKALGGFVQLPRLGKIRVKESTARLRGRILSATLSRDADRWHVSFTVERERKEPEGVEGPVVGIDVGVEHFATLSTGERLESPRPLKTRLRRLKRLARRHSRKQKGSMKRRKSAVCLARLQRRIRNCRLDFLRKTTTHLARTKKVIVIEDLAVKNLTKSARGTKAKPGRWVRQKSGLNRSILDQGWGMFRRMLEYKTTWYGSVLIEAPRFHASSKTCSACGELLTDGLPLSVRQWTCPSCAAEHDRDLNAAINLERIATESSSGSHARGDSSDGGTDTSPVYESRVVEAGSERWISAAGP